MIDLLFVGQSWKYSRTSQPHSSCARKS